MNAVDLSKLEPYLEDPDVTDVMINGMEAAYVTRNGELQAVDIQFADENEIVTLIQRIVNAADRTIDAQNPIVDVRLPDGSRVNAVLRPVALTGPTLTISKFHRMNLTWEQLVEFGSLSPKLLVFLKACVSARLNMVIAGDTNAGKTTVLNAMGAFFNPDERVITAETNAEINLDHQHVIALEAQPAAPGGDPAIPMTALVRNARRMRAQRIITGEVEDGGAAWEMLQAMSLGYEGSMFTIHASSPQDVIDRLELMITAAPGLPLLQIRARIAQGIDLITQQTYMEDRRRRIVSVAAVTGLKNNLVELQEVFRFVITEQNEDRLVGEFRTTGYIPPFADQLDLPQSFFAG